MRASLLAGNWKMHKCIEETKRFFQKFLALANGLQSHDIIFFVPFIDLAIGIEVTKGTSIQIGAQNAHWENEGAYTGEISMKMLQSMNCSWVLIGHSERRQYFGETNETTNRKVKAAFAHELSPLLCVGESLQEREQGRIMEILMKQLYEGLQGLSSKEAIEVVIAYEPIWAIGTGVSATSEDAQLVCYLIRKLLKEQFGEAADQITILYGGSVKMGNAAKLLSQPDIDGVLVGNASLNPEEFIQIFKA